MRFSYKKVSDKQIVQIRHVKYVSQVMEYTVSVIVENPFFSISPHSQPLFFHLHIVMENFLNRICAHQNSPKNTITSSAILPETKIIWIPSQAQLLLRWLVVPPPSLPKPFTTTTLLRVDYAIKQETPEIITSQSLPSLPLHDAEPLFCLDSLLTQGTRSSILCIILCINFPERVLHFIPD